MLCQALTPHNPMKVSLTLSLIPHQSVLASLVVTFSLSHWHFCNLSSRIHRFLSIHSYPFSAINPSHCQVMSMSCSCHGQVMSQSCPSLCQVITHSWQNHCLPINGKVIASSWPCYGKVWLCYGQVMMRSCQSFGKVMVKSRTPWPSFFIQFVTKPLPVLSIPVIAK